MKTTRIAIYLALELILISGCSMKLADNAGPEGSVTWSMDTQKNIGGFPTLQIGNPEIIETPGGLGLRFDGNEDGLQVNTNLLAGAEAFTVEAVFRPDTEGSLDQSFLHIRELSGDNAVLLEIHTVTEQWYLRSSIQSGGDSRTLDEDTFPHDFNKWYHVAMVYDGTSMRQYVNGNQELSAPIHITPLERGRTSLGTHMDLGGWFKGIMLKVRFTPRALEQKDFMKR